MRSARTFAGRGDFAGALKLVDKLKPDDIARDLVRTELEYLKIVYKVKLAITRRNGFRRRFLRGFDFRRIWSRIRTIRPRKRSNWPGKTRFSWRRTLGRS